MPKSPLVFLIATVITLTSCSKPAPTRDDFLHLLEHLRHSGMTDIEIGQFESELFLKDCELLYSKMLIDGRVSQDGMRREDQDTYGVGEAIAKTQPEEIYASKAGLKLNYFLAPSVVFFIEYVHSEEEFDKEYAQETLEIEEMGHESALYPISEKIVAILVNLDSG